MYSDMEITNRQYTLDEIYTVFKSFRSFADKEPRLGQLEAIQFILNSPMSVVVIRGSTGVGKSILGITASRLIDDAIYLVQSKSLQTQITNDFPYPETKSLFGRNNYPCNHIMSLSKNDREKYKDWTASGCPFKKPHKDCSMYSVCTYRIEKEITVNSNIRILNYSYYLIENNYVAKSRFNDHELIICDEADTLESTLLDFVSIRISEKQMREFSLPRPKYKTAQAKHGVESWIEWADKSYNIIKNKRARLPDDVPKSEIEKYSSLMYKLKDFKSFVDTTWIYDEYQTRYGVTWTFSPTWLTPEITDKYLRSHGNKFVLMSATFPSLPALSLELGIPVDEIDYYEMQTSFSPENKPVYICSVAMLSKRNIESEFPKIRNAIEKILEMHKDDKGLIHTSNYTLAKLIMEIDNDRLISHNTDNRLEVLDEFKKSNKPLVLVSPSMERGISLDDDMARFIIIAKVPFADLGNKQVSQRFYSSLAGKIWYDAVAVQTIEQESGRGVRNEDDWCNIFILDGWGMKLLSRNPEMFSKHFRKCIEEGYKSYQEYAGELTNNNKEINNL